MIRQFYKQLTLTVISSFFSFILIAQSSADTTGTNTDGMMRSHDKIYVVMAVCITILAVLLLYLVRIDTKISKKEKLS
ncbi:MAG: CcmD family protein [Ginsengibacter sp.]